MFEHECKYIIVNWVHSSVWIIYGLRIHFVLFRCIDHIKVWLYRNGVFLYICEIFSTQKQILIFYINIYVISMNINRHNSGNRIHHPFREIPFLVQYILIRGSFGLLLQCPRTNIKGSFQMDAHNYLNVFKKYCVS